MITFRQFLEEEKKKKKPKKELTPHEKKYGVATHFAHSDNRKSKKEKITEGILDKIKSIMSFSGGDPHPKPKSPPVPVTKNEAVINHLQKRPVNTHLLPVPEYSKDPNSSKRLTHQHHSRLVEFEMEKSYPYSKVPHKAAIKNYTNQSKGLNNQLYINHLQGKQADHGIDKRYNLEHLDKATTHHTLKHDLTVFSGVTKRVPEDAAKHPDRKVYHPGFVSTSLDAHTASDFSKSNLVKHDDGTEHFEHHMLRIHLKPGHKMLHVGTHSEFDHEREVILPRGHTFKLADKPETHHIKGDFVDGPRIDKLHIWDAHIVDHKK